MGPRAAHRRTCPNQHDRTFDKVSVIDMSCTSITTQGVAQHLTAGSCSRRLCRSMQYAYRPWRCGHTVSLLTWAGTSMSIPSNAFNMVKPALELFPLAFAKHTSPYKRFQYPTGGSVTRRMMDVHGQSCRGTIQPRDEPVARSTGTSSSA